MIYEYRELEEEKNCQEKTLTLENYKESSTTKEIMKSLTDQSDENKSFKLKESEYQEFPSNISVIIFYQ